MSMGMTTLSVKSVFRVCLIIDNVELPVFVVESVLSLHVAFPILFLESE
jgi:hypothetical protein